MSNSRPLFFYSLAALCGCFIALGKFIAIVPLTFLITKKPLLALFAASFFIYTLMVFQVPEKPIHGIGEFHIVNIQGNVYRGILKRFWNGETCIGKNIPVTLYSPKTHLGNCDYVVEGTLSGRRFQTTGPWQKTDIFSLAEWRKETKKAVSKYVHKHISNATSATFLTGLLTGHFDNKLLPLAFKRFGLQHLMAISGFHFAIVAFLLSLFLRLILPHKLCLCTLLIALTSYFLFLGPTPSIMRAWIMAVFFFISLFGIKQSSPLNALGLALILNLVYAPADCLNIGFQLSYLITGSILIFTPLFDRLFRVRNFESVKQMSLLDQHGYIILRTVQTSFALLMAVNIVAIPVLLARFGFVPLLSLIFNVFIPPLVSLAVFFFAIGLFPISEAITSFLIHWIEHVPTNFDLMIRFELPVTCTIAFLTLLLAIDLYGNFEHNNSICGGRSSVG